MTTNKLPSPSGAGAFVEMVARRCNQAEPPRSSHAALSSPMAKTMTKEDDDDIGE